MKASVNRDLLHDACGKLSKVITRSIVAARECFFIKVDGNEMIISAASNELYAETKIPCIMSDGNFSCLAPAGVFFNIIGKIFNNTIILEAEKKDNGMFLMVKGGKVRTRISCLDAKLWNPPTKITDPEFEIETDFLLPAILECKHALPTSEMSVPCTFYVQCDSKDWNIMCLDGYRISSRGNRKLNKTHEFILPGATMCLLKNILETKVKMIVQKNLIQFTDSSTKVQLNTIAGSYFNVKGVMNHDLPYHVTLNKNDILETLELACLLFGNSKKNRRPVHLSFSRDEMEIHFEDKVSNVLNGIVPIKSNIDSNFTIGINPKFFLDSIKSLPGDTVEFNLKNAKTPIIFKNDESLELILPITSV